MILNRQQIKVRIRRIKEVLRMVFEDLGYSNCETSILLIDNDGIRELNRTYLGKDKPTDVLSFPMEEKDLIGDIAISVERASENAELKGVNLNEELTGLLIHGALHLLGHKHEKGGIKAKRMRKEEERLFSLIMKKIA
jgi:probable rRNA maturation factor